MPVIVFHRTSLPTLLAILGICLAETASGGGLRLGLGQEIGRDGRITTEGRSSSDLYSETSFRVGLDHPAVFLDHRVTLDPIVGISYMKYLELSNLDMVGFDISGPLSLQLEGVGDDSDLLRLSAGITRDTGAVSTSNSTQTTSTAFGMDTLYMRYWSSPRWKSELRYRYDQRLYDDALYKDQDSITHTLSAAMLHGLNRAVSVGARATYTRKDYSGETYLASDTVGVEALSRWQITSKVDSEFALGSETASYQGGGSESGVTVRGVLDYQVTPRWQCAGMVRHQLEPSGQAGRMGVATNVGNVQVSYRFTPKLTGMMTPAVRSETGDDQVTELSFAVEATYAFHWVDLTLQAGITDRSSDRSEDDTYVAVDTALRVVWVSGSEAGRRRDLRRLGRRH
jgi:hypothetical protein